MDSKRFLRMKHVALTVQASAHLLSDGFAVQLVVHFPDLGDSERRHRECREPKGNLLLRHQGHRAGGSNFSLGVFTCKEERVTRSHTHSTLTMQH